MSNQFIPEVGGSVWLDLANTMYLSDGHKVDLLAEYESVIQWLIKTNLIVQENVLLPQTIVQEEQFTQKLVELRTICFSIIRDLEKQKEVSEESIGALKNFASELHITVTIEMNNGLPVTLYKGASTQEDVLYQVISSIVDTLQTVSADRIKKCEHDECILLFVDTSKSGKRRWCSMQTCGNRYKAAKYYAKNKSIT